jgi:thiol-disulfide isomerase/thioredoxin
VGLRLLVVIALFTGGLAFAGQATLKAPTKALSALASDKSFSGDVSSHEVTVVQFWASWCIGCAQVMAEMSDILASRHDIGYVSISLDETKNTALKYFTNKTDTVRSTMKSSYLDPSGSLFSEANGVDSLPYLVFVNKNGSIIKRIQGHPTKADFGLLLGTGSKK